MNYKSVSILKSIILSVILIMLIMVCSCHNGSGTQNGHDETTEKTDITDTEMNDTEKETLPADSVIATFDPISLQENSGSVASGQGHGVPFIIYTVNPTVIYKKENVPKREITIFGDKMTCYYISSNKKALLDYEVDVYSHHADIGYYGFRFNNLTGELVQYRFNSKETENNSGSGYQSPVNPSSTEEAYITYAKSILAEYCGFSSDGWTVRTETEIVSMTEGRRTVWDEFIVSDNGDPNVQTEYTFTFYRELSGIQRIDKVYVRMSNTGVVYEFWCETYDDLYEQYSNVYIDSEKLKSMVESAFSRSGINALSHQTEYQIVPFEGNLVVEATVQYKYPCDDGSEHVDKGEKRYTIVATIPQDEVD